MTGKEAQTVLDEVGITLNMNTIAGDTRKPMDPSGIRFGTPAITTRGFKEKECKYVAELMVKVLKNKDNKKLKEFVHKEIKNLLKISNTKKVCVNIFICHIFTKKLISR